VVESDEVYINAGEKGRPHPTPEDPPRRRANKRKGHGTWATDRPPVQGVVGRTSGEIRLRVLRNSDAVALRGLLEAVTTPECTVNTDEWRGYNWVGGTGRIHKTVNHTPGQREWARDEDGDGVREVHSNTIEGLWTGVRNFVRPLRGVSKWFLSGYLAVFEWAHNLQVVLDELIVMMLVPFTSEST
jgi:transposase